jgi:hypothetical protein
LSSSDYLYSLYSLPTDPFSTNLPRYTALHGIKSHSSIKEALRAMLRRRNNEPFKQLLAHLDRAIASATIDEVYVDEVNTPQS